MQHKPIMIMAGGTGGHIYPALAVADFIRSKDIPLYWLGTQRGLESTIVPENDIELLTLNIGGIRGKGLVRILFSPIKIVVAVYQAMRIFLHLKPAVVLGMGGFVSGPGGIAAWLLRIPLYIHEQNRVVGLTNSLLAPFAQYIFEGFPDTFANKKKVVSSGNPVRSAITVLEEPEVRMTTGSNSIKILVLGGSQGAVSLNRVVPEALSAVSSTHALEVWHQCGTEKYQATELVYQDLKLDAVRLDGYIEDMAAAYSWADLAICRAGALTIAELTAAGLGAILIPFPYAVDDHQTMNARYLSDVGAAILCQETDLNVVELKSILVELCKNKQQLLSMAKKSRKMACFDAARVVGEYCLGERI